MRGRALIYAALALAVPLPALAISGDDTAEAPPAPETLTVSASLDSCGTATDTIVCKIDASWNEITGADRYTASVTRADGSVVDFGDVGAGGSSFWVPYVGNGTYTVTVSVYGTLPGSKKPERIARDSSAADEDAPQEQTLSTPGADATGVATDEDPDGTDPDPGTDPDEPTCEEPEPEPDPEPPAPVTPGDPDAPNTSDAAAAPLSEKASAQLDTSAELPESVDCPDAEPPAGPATG